MNIAVSGSRDAGKEHWQDIVQTLLPIIRENQPHNILNGGCEGVDLMVLVFCDSLKSVIDLPFKNVTVLPGTLRDVRKKVRKCIIEYSDEIIELGHEITEKDGWAAFRKRNEELVERADILVAFPSIMKSLRSGTRMTINIAKEAGVETKVKELE